MFGLRNVTVNITEFIRISCFLKESSNTPDNARTFNDLISYESSPFIIRVGVLEISLSLNNRFLNIIPFLIEHI